MKTWFSLILFGAVCASAQINKTARPTATPPGQTFAVPVAVSLQTATPGATILYTIDGTTPAETASGTTRVYTGPIPLGASMVLKSIAVKTGYAASDVMTEAYVYAPPILPMRGWYKDEDGDGRIETAYAEFSRDLPVLPAKLEFAILDRSDTVRDYVAGPEDIAFAAGSRSRIRIRFARPFPYGLTSVRNGETSGHCFAQSDIPLLESPFAMLDSVPPVILEAKATYDEDLHFPILEVKLSEDVKTLTTYNSAFLIRTGGRTLSTATLSPRVAKLPDLRFTILLDTASGYHPAFGDSLSLNPDGTLSDASSNIAGLHFVPVTGFGSEGIAIPFALRRDGGLAYRHGRFSGSELAVHPPLSIACYDALGVLLGMAKRKAATVWEAPEGGRMLFAVFSMRDGSRRYYRVGP
jgi:hypothetical protein